MFEVIGFLTARFFGLGWLWGKVPEGEVYGSGNGFMALGLIICIAVMATIAACGGFRG